LIGPRPVEEPRTPFSSLTTANHTRRRPRGGAQSKGTWRVSGGSSWGLQTSPVCLDASGTRPRPSDPEKQNASPSRPVFQSNSLKTQEIATNRTQVNPTLSTLLSDRAFPKRDLKPWPGSHQSRLASGAPESGSRMRAESSFDALDVGRHVYADGIVFGLCDADGVAVFEPA
jgi:hypothetical protein